MAPATAIRTAPVAPPTVRYHSAAPTEELNAHARCGALSGLLRGKLCQRLATRPARRIARGRYLYLIGDSAASLYLVKSGLIKTIRTSPAGEELLLHLHGPGEILGELCFCTAERREHAVALETSEVVEIPLDDLAAQLRRTPEAALDMVEELADRLGRISTQLQSLALEPTVARLARTLLILADTLGEITPHGVQITHYVRQEELAQMIAARREVVSGLLNRLRERGLIDYSRKGQISVHRAELDAYLATLTKANRK